MMAIALVVLHFAVKGDAMGDWLWPDSRKAGTYKRLAAINIAAVLTLLVLPQLPGVLAILFCAIVIPMGTMIFNVLALSSRDASTKSKGVSEPYRQQLSYFSAISTLLMVLSVLPCLSLFTSGWDFEQRLLILRSQRRRAADLDDRTERVRVNYVAVELGPKLKQELFTEPDEKTDQYFS